jgi:hypothetical protein
MRAKTLQCGSHSLGVINASTTSAFHPHLPPASGGPIHIALQLAQRVRYEIADHTDVATGANAALGDRQQSIQRWPRELVGAVKPAAESD